VSVWTFTAATMTDLALTRIELYQETKLLDLTHEFNLKKQQLFSSASLLPASQRVQDKDEESVALEKKRELAFLARLCNCVCVCVFARVCVYYFYLFVFVSGLALYTRALL
jgi:hypothetical protein